MMPARATIAEILSSVLADKGAIRREAADGDTLTGTLGLDSLDLAVVVVRLEQRLGVDPFRSGRPAVATFGELVSVYEQALPAGS